MTNLTNALERIEADLLKAESACICSERCRDCNTRDYSKSLALIQAIRDEKQGIYDKYRKSAIKGGYTVLEHRRKQSDRLLNKICGGE